MREKLPGAEPVDPRHPGFRINAKFIDYCVGYALRGLKPDTIAPIVGILPTTFRIWLETGKEHRQRFEQWLTKRMELPTIMPEDEVVQRVGAAPHPSMYAELYYRMAQAYAQNEAGHVRVIQQRSEDGDARAAQWMLERRYGWVEMVEATSEEKHDECSVDELHTKIARLAAAR